METWNNLEFDNLGKQKIMDFFRTIMEKPGTVFNLNLLTTSILRDCWFVKKNKNQSSLLLVQEGE